MNLAGAGGHVAVVGGPRSGKSTLLRTIADQPRADHHPERDAVLRPRLRRRHVRAAGRPAARRRRRHPLRARRRTPRRTPRCSASSTGASATSAQQGIDSIETYRSRRRRGPRRRRLRRRVPRSSTAGARCARTSTSSRWSCSRWPSAASPSACTSWPAPPGGPTSAPRPATCSAPGSSCVSATRSTPRSTARSPSWCRTAAPAAAWSRPSCTSSPRCPASTASPTATPSASGVEDLVERSRKAWRGEQGPKLRLLPERIELAQVHEQVGRQRDLDRRPASLPRHRRAGPRPGRPRRRARAAPADLRRQPLGQERAAAHLPPRGDADPRPPRRRRSSWSTTAASLLGEVPEDYPLHYLTSATQAQPAIAELAQYLQSRLPGPDVTPEQLRNRSWWTGAEVFVVIDDYDLVSTQSELADRAAGAAAGPGPRRRPAPRAGAALRRRGACPLRARHPVAARPRDARSAAVRQPRRGPAHRHHQAPPGVSGRGQLITRDRGVEVVQTVWTDPSI